VVDLAISVNFGFLIVCWWLK